MCVWNLHRESRSVVADDVITHGLIAELQQKVNQLEQKLDKLESEMCLFPGRHFFISESRHMQNTYVLRFVADSRCAFAARGSGSESTKIINDSPIVYNEVELNICNAYNVTTGKRFLCGEIFLLQTGAHPGFSFGTGGSQPFSICFLLKFKINPWS